MWQQMACIRSMNAEEHTETAPLLPHGRLSKAQMLMHDQRSGVVLQMKACCVQDVALPRSCTHCMQDSCQAYAALLLSMCSKASAEAVVHLWQLP